MKDCYWFGTIAECNGLFRDACTDCFAKVKDDRNIDMDLKVNDLVVWIADGTVGKVVSLDIAGTGVNMVFPGGPGNCLVAKDKLSLYVRKLAI